MVATIQPGSLAYPPAGRTQAVEVVEGRLRRPVVFLPTLGIHFLLDSILPPSVMSNQNKIGMGQARDRRLPEPAAVTIENVVPV